MNGILLETSKICENTKKRKKCSESSPNFKNCEKKGFLEKNAPEVPGSSGGRAPQFRGVPGRSDFKHSFGKGSSGEFRGGVAKVGLQERQKPSLHPKRLRRPNFPKFRKIGKLAEILGFSLSSALAPRKRQVLKFERCPLSPLFFFPCVSWK